MIKSEIVRMAGINKFSNYHKFYDFIAQRKDFKRFVEVGVWKGQGVVYLVNKLLETRKDFEVVAVDLFEDLWKYKNFEKLYEGYGVKEINKMYQYNTRDVEKYITKIKGYSDEVAEQFEDGYFDFVFIDADHEHEQVTKDILAWLPKVRKGGIISGHDYVASQQGVIKAVNKIFRNKRKIFSGYVWYVEVE